MAESLSHKWGQVIGDMLEVAILPYLNAFAEKHSLYVDKKGARPARKGKKATWIDINKNKHDLDFVLERGGSPTVIGKPVAFIETAWRRYTKHSRNKAQEIQGAIVPLVAVHHKSSPFMGAILAGEFTSGSLEQLKSLNFAVLYFSYASVVKAFAEIRIDASFDENTAEDMFKVKNDAWEAASIDDKTKVASKLMALNKTAADGFIAKLERSVNRTINAIYVLPLHGESSTLDSITDAIQFIEGYNEGGESKPVVHYIVQIRYDSGDQIEGKFSDKEEAIKFLRDYEPLAIKPAI